MFIIKMIQSHVSYCEGEILLQHITKQIRKLTKRIGFGEGKLGFGL
jgi:hypothetical protein